VIRQTVVSTGLTRLPEGRKPGGRSERRWKIVVFATAF